MIDYKVLCAELLAALEEEASNWNLDPEDHPLVIRARAALAIDSTTTEITNA